MGTVALKVTVVCGRRSWVADNSRRFTSACFMFSVYMFLSYLIGLLPDLTVSKPEFQFINTAAVKLASLPAQCCCRGKRLMLLSWEGELQRFPFAGKALPKTCVLWNVVIQFSMDRQNLGPGERQIFSLYTEFLFFWVTENIHYV